MRIAIFMRPDPADARASKVKPNVSAVNDEVVDALRAGGSKRGPVSAAEVNRTQA